MIRVVLVDDSKVAVSVMRRMLSSSQEVEVVGTAVNGREGLEMVETLRPDVICTDLHMPVMNGLEFTREVMRRFQTPILVVSVSVHRQDNHDNVFQLLDAGAIDVFPKPRGGLLAEDARTSAEFIRKVKVLSGVVPIRRHQKGVVVEGETQRPAPEAVSISDIHLSGRILAIGASTGGPPALQEIFSALPAGFPLPILCVQHISEGFLSDLVQWLNNHCTLPVVIAEEGEKPEPGKIYFPQEESHLILDAKGKMRMSRVPPYNHHRPSVTVTFRSVAETYGSGGIAVLLTGMGMDGAEGMLSIHRAGGITIAQDENTSVVFGMPKRAIELEAVRHILPLPQIAQVVSQARLSSSVPVFQKAT